MEVLWKINKINKMTSYGIWTSHPTGRETWRNWATQSFQASPGLKPWQHQWNLLKTIFNREVKREDSKISGTSTDTEYTSQWKYIKSLMFIKGSDDVEREGQRCWRVSYTCLIYCISLNMKAHYIRKSSLGRPGSFVSHHWRAWVKFKMAGDLNTWNVSQ